MTPTHGQPVPQPAQPSVVAASGDPAHRERFDAHELAIVLSHYDIGVIHQLRVYPRGSRRSPKLRIRSDQGEFLLKRRAPGKDDPYRVAFDHTLQIRLAEHGYPVPGLLGTRVDNNSMLQLNGRAYEMFNFIHGTRYDHSEAAAGLVGAALGRLHRHLSRYRPDFAPPVGSYHAATEVDATMALITPAVRHAEPRTDHHVVSRTVEFLRQAYHEASRRINDLGYSTWLPIVLHGDWHPGNILYRNGTIVGVLDFDAARVEPRVVDVSNGVLQFSIRMGGSEDPANWPEGLDMGLIQSLVQGYDEETEKPLAKAERAAMPWLVIEALVAEAIVPIAATGSFSRIAGSAFLSMVQRKVRWVASNARAMASVK